MTNHQKLQALVQTVFLLSPSEYRLSLKKEEIEAWDSLAVVSLQVGLRDAFGVEVSPQDLASFGAIEDILKLLASKGADFNE